MSRDTECKWSVFFSGLEALEELYNMWAWNLGLNSFNYKVEIILNASLISNSLESPAGSIRINNQIEFPTNMGVMTYFK